MEDLVEVHLVLLLQILVHHAANAGTKTHELIKFCLSTLLAFSIG